MKIKFLILVLTMASVSFSQTIQRTVMGSGGVVMVGADNGGQQVEVHGTVSQFAINYQIGAPSVEQGVGFWYTVRQVQLSGGSGVNILVPQLTEFTGRTIRIPIVLQNVLKLPTGNAPTLVTKVRFRKTLLLPRGIPATDLQEDSLDFIVTTRGLIADTVQGTVISSFQCYTLLGDTDRTPLTIEDAYLEEYKSTPITKQDGLFLAKGICVAGSDTRFLVRSAAGTKLSAPDPNPVSSTATFFVDASERGKHTIFLLDGLGKKVAEIAKSQLDPGHFSFTGDFTNYPSGRYHLKLETPSEFLVVPFIINH